MDRCEPVHKTERMLVILDRDGVINEDSDAYVKSVSEWIPLPGSLSAIARLNHAGFQVAVATKQSGLARGLFSQSDLDAMHERMVALLAARGGELDAVVYCPHGPEAGCDCRKPRPGLLRQIAAVLRRDLHQAVVVGDSLRDLQAAVTVGARPVLVRTGKGADTEMADDLPPGTVIFDDLAAVVDWLIAMPAWPGDGGRPQ